LIVNSNVRNIFVTRSKIINYLRRFLDMRNFVEVETPSKIFSFFLASFFHFFFEKKGRDSEYVFFIFWFC